MSISSKLWVGVLLVCGLIASTGIVNAADHRDAPKLEDSARMGSRDLNDVYLFRSPANARNTVMIMTVNPFAGVLSPTTFEPGILYDFCIDNDGDAVEDLVYRYRFINIFGTKRQVFTLELINKRTILGQLGFGIYITAGLTGVNRPVAFGGTTICSNFDDPFFFDSAGFRNGFQFTGANFFAKANISAMVLEVPTRNLLNKKTQIGLWSRTLSTGTLGLGLNKVQFDRNGRPAINTVLIPLAKKDAFNTAIPSRDRRDFGALAAATLVSLGRTQADANALVLALFPDILTMDTASADGFLNGRKLADDVIDAELNLLTAGGITTDLVNSNDRPFRNVFPYLPPPQVIAP